MPVDIATWIIRHVDEDILRGRPIPAGIGDYVRDLLAQAHAANSRGRGCDSATTAHPARMMEIGTREMAQRMGCSPQYVRRLAQAGRIPGHKTAGGWWRFTEPQETSMGMAVRTLDEIRQAILAGEHVDPDELARARALAEIDELRREAERLAAEREAEAQRLAQIQQIRDDVLTAAADVDDQADIEAIAAAVARIIARHQRRAAAVRDARARLARLGVPEGHEVEGIAWRQAGMGRPDCLVVSGRTLSVSAHPGDPIAAALADGCRRADAKPGLLAPYVRI